MTKGLPLINGAVTLVDDDVYEWAVKRRWRQHSEGYAVQSCNTGGHHGKLLHRLVLGLSDRKVDCDHKNGDRLDNRRLNLRACTRAENLRNVKARGQIPYKGVYRHTRSGSYIARGRTLSQCGEAGKEVHLGTFPTAEDAARAYDVFARKNYPEFARPNFPEEPLEEQVRMVEESRIDTWGKVPFRGVYWDKRRQKYKAQGRVPDQSGGSGKPVAIGRFDTAEDAARAYDSFVLEHYGSTAKLNFPEAQQGERQ